MRVRSDALAISLFASLLVAAPAWATGAAAPAAAPAGCSAGAIPDAPVKGMVGGKAFVPGDADVQIGHGFALNDAKFATYDLTLKVGGSIFNELEVHIIVREGQVADGKTFRMVESSSIGDQPMAVKGAPEVQGWGLSFEPAKVDTNFTQAVASMRLEFGQRKGNMLPGKISFCVPDVKATIAGNFNAKIGQ
jgi:hypothetical protein